MADGHNSFLHQTGAGFITSHPREGRLPSQLPLWLLSRRDLPIRRRMGKAANIKRGPKSTTLAEWLLKGQQPRRPGTVRLAKTSASRSPPWFASDSWITWLPARIYWPTHKQNKGEKKKKIIINHHPGIDVYSNQFHLADRYPPCPYSAATILKQAAFLGQTLPSIELSDSGFPLADARLFFP